MPVERLKLSATLTYKWVAAALLGWGAATTAMPQLASGAEIRFATPEAAYEQGLGAFRAGRPELAVSAFEFASEQEHLQAQYYIAKIYSNNNGGLTDHAKAFALYQRIVDKYAYIDPYYDFRSTFVARSFVALAGYYRTGVAAIKMPANPQAAADLLNHAATYFGDLEAQFELAKMSLAGEGLDEDVRRGLHWLSSLARKNHAGAQAFLADLLWRGKYVGRDPAKALVYISLAVEGMSEQDRLWIEDVHQVIFCGSAPGAREKTGQMVANWRRTIDGPSNTNTPPSLIERGVVPVEIPAHNDTAVRTCSDGAVVKRSKSDVPVPNGPPTSATAGTVTGTADDPMPAALLAAPNSGGGGRAPGANPRTSNGR